MNKIWLGRIKVLGAGNMNHGRAYLRHHALLTAVAVAALAHSAFADEDLLGRRTRAVEAVVTPTLDAADLSETTLPHAMNREIDESDLREAHGITLDFLPRQGRMSSKPPFIDFSKWEVGAFAGAVMYSSDFEAGLNYVIGATTRVPVTGLGQLGIYAEALISYVDRDLPFFYDHRAGSWFGIGIGLDYTLWKGSLGYIRPQVGVLYAYWNGVNSLDNGIGVTVGVQIGLFWVKNNEQTSITFMPQFQMTKGGDYMIFLPIGFLIDF